MKDLVSVIIPTYKRSETLCSSIESVLNQDYKHIEIIVVDDNGRGTHFQVETESKLRQYIDNGNIKYIVHDVNKNGSAARNTGFHASSGVFINFLDDDDKLLPSKISSQVNSLTNTESKVGASYCNSRIIHRQNITHRLLVHDSQCQDEGNLCKKYIMGQVEFNTSMILFKREAIEKLNGFNESYYRHQDYELMVRFFRYFTIVCSGPESLALYDQTTIRLNTPNSQRDYEIKKKFLSEFKSDFEKIDCYDEIAHNLWWKGGYTALLNKEYILFIQMYKQGRNHARYSIKEYIRFIRSYIVGLMLK